jgi:hypothetical protein
MLSLVASPPMSWLSLATLLLQRLDQLILDRNLKHVLIQPGGISLQRNDRLILLLKSIEIPKDDTTLFDQTDLCTHQQDLEETGNPTTTHLYLDLVHLGVGLLPRIIKGFPFPFSTFADLHLVLLQLLNFEGDLIEMSLDLFHPQRSARYQRCQQQTSKTAQLGVVPTHLPLQLPDRFNFSANTTFLLDISSCNPSARFPTAPARYLYSSLPMTSSALPSSGTAAAGCVVVVKPKVEAGAAGLGKVAMVVEPKLEDRAAGFGMGRPLSGEVCIEQDPLPQPY